MADPIHQFVIQEIVKFQPGGVNLSFTNSSLWMVIAATLSVGFLSLAMTKRAMVPGRLQMAAEMLYEFIYKMVDDTIGHDGRKYFPLIFTLFMFIVMGNFLGLVPHSFTYTSHLVVTATLALIIFFMVIGFGLYNHGLHFFSLFLPPNVPVFLIPLLIPIEVISFFVRPLTLSVRLFANMMAGHIVLKVVASFSVAAASAGGIFVVFGILPVFVNLALLMLECLVAFVQAYVFAILACVYLKDSVELHH